MSKEALLAALQPILQALPAIDVSDPAQARAELERRFPPASLTALRALVRQGVEERWLCDKENAGVRFSRVQKAIAPPSRGNAGGGTGVDDNGPATWSIDAVHMSGAALGHTHPNGEIDLCFAVPAAGESATDARFDDQREGWVVYDKATWHVPTVTGGAMDILYFLPGGAIRFEDQPAPSSSSSSS